MKLICGCLLSLAVLAAPALAGETGGGPAVLDRFGRELNREGIVLVDWEGQLANPAVTLSLRAPAGAEFPLRAELSADDERLYFDLPSEVGANGPTKTLELEGPEPVSFRLAIFPDRDGEDDDEEYHLTVRLTGRGRAPGESRVLIRILDQDADREPEFPVTVDFGQDRTGFFEDEARRALVRQAAADWTYFLADPGLDPTPAGAERTWIWETTSFRRGEPVTNEAEYTGYLLYAYGIQTNEVRSGGEPSDQGEWQMVKGKALPVRRSGGLEIETRGNFNRLGWFVTETDDDWWRSGNLGHEVNDLYSIVRHEMGHSFFFNPHNRNFPRGRRLNTPAIRAYLGHELRVDNHDHFDGTVDPASGYGAFGYEYHGVMPRKRWLITKLDLLVAGAIGYTLRETTPFLPLVLTEQELPAARRGEEFRATAAASGGVPPYCCRVTDGELAPGLSLDSFTGEIRGVPERAGTFRFTVEARDQLDAAASRVFSLTVR